MAVDIIRFNYTDSRGHNTDWELKNWQESGNYLQGICLVDSRFRTFRKDRVARYLEGSERALSEPFTSPPPKLEAKPEVLFTGFKKEDKSALESLASEHGMQVRTKVTKALDFLCCGENAGPSKIAAARNQGTFILGERSFKAMIEEGDVKDDDFWHLN